MTAADKILKRELEELNRQAGSEVRMKGLEWDFIPAHSPHIGGCYERIIGLFKKHLKVVCNGDPLHVDVLNTVIVEIEGIVNRRPLTAVSADPKDCAALTPNHILAPAATPSSSNIVIPNVPTTEAERLRCTWKRAQDRVNSFWKTWSKEYLTTLHPRAKWRKTRRDAAVDDLVLLVDESTPRGEWRLGRIVQVGGTDSHVRKALVKRADGKVVLRDRTKLVLLEVEDGEAVVGQREAQ